MARWVKCLIALVLLPFLFASIWFLWICLERTTVWPVRELGLLGVGVLMALLAYLWLPRPTWLYVFGHETTHALAVWCSGGRVLDFRVSGKGGRVVSDRISPVIALAPYVFPFYPAVVVVLWLGLEMIWPQVQGVRDVFWMVWGVAWGFHGAFTVSVLKTAQPDFASQGYFFSFVAVALGNVWLTTGLLWWWLRPFSLGEGMVMVGQMTGQSYERVWAWIGWATEWLWSLRRSR